MWSSFLYKTYDVTLLDFVWRNSDGETVLNTFIDVVEMLGFIISIISI